MLKRLLGSKRERRRAIARPEIEMPPIAPDRPVYAIGDLHGRVDLLAKLVEMILSECADHPAPQLVFLGDYIDRGDRVRETLDLLLEIAAVPELSSVFLMGNHERMLLDFLADPVREARWLRVGGLQTCLSFAVGAYETVSPAELARVQVELGAALVPYRALLERLVPLYLSGNVLFAHAAADPARPPEQQTEQALLWGHPDFERVPRHDGLWVVHGHRVVAEPRIERGRIAADTGAYFTGALTAAAIEAGSIRFLTATVAS